MKKQLLVGLFMMLASASFAQFTAGNLAIYRYGNGTDALANGTRVPVFVDQYTPAGVFVSTTPIPQTASGANYGLEGLGLTAGGAYEAEGYPVLSNDGSVLSIMGYNPAVSGQFVIGTVNSAGTVNTSTLVVDDIGAPRSAVVNGIDVYFNGYQNGVRYKALGTATASVRVSVNQNAPRVLTIAETSLSAVPVVSVKLFAPESITSIPMTNLPTVSTTLSTLAFSGDSPVNAHQVIALKSTSTPARTLLYVLDDNGGSPVIRKYRSNAGGDTWIAYGTISVPLGTKSLSATISAAGAKLYYTTLGTPGSTNSQLLTYTDVFTAGNEIANISGTGTVLATAAANTVFRGVTMAPTGGVLPVSLTKFEAKENQNTIKLSWTTVSEKNSSRFDVLRSFDGKDFQKIGSVNASGNSDASIAYAFTDENPFPGVNYYKLQQFDNNGDASFYGPIQTKSNLEKANFSIHASKEKSTVDVWVYSLVKQSAEISLTNINGQTSYKQSLNLEKGYNKVTLAVSGSKTGLQLATLKMQNTVITTKFMWQ